MTNTIHETQVKYQPFPLLAKKLKDLQKNLSDAQWEGNQSDIDRLCQQIDSVEVQISLGEKYDIPF
jgi:hypothetical protein